MCVSRYVPSELVLVMASISRWRTTGSPERVICRRERKRRERESEGDELRVSERDR